MRIAIVGTGIAGLVAARRLHEEHEITVFEAAEHVGGHTHTVTVEEDGRSVPVDTGFIVYNERNYPLFTRLLTELGVPTRSSDMSFSVRDETSGLEYRGSSLNTLFSQRRNLFRPRFHRMVRDILRFYREGSADAEGGVTLGDYLDSAGYSEMFGRMHLVPMASALWSTDAHQVRRMPLHFLVRFLENHGMMRLRGRPRWRTVRGGSHQYVRALIQPFRNAIRLRTPVVSVRREPGRAWVSPRGVEPMPFDRVVLAVHSDQALALLQDPSPAEREILGAIRYQANDVLLHTDERLLPRNRRAWSSWNAHVLSEPGSRPTVTYLMNKLQGLRTRLSYCVSLNRNDAVDPDAILGRFQADHPVFDTAALAAQARFEEINGVQQTHYCGAYWGFGFHEDGVRSAIRAVQNLGAPVPSLVAT